jgi:hypothetical protein
VRFQKASANPVLTWFPERNVEEGATSVAPVVDGNRVILYYGASTWAGADKVNANARMAVSDDAIRFGDQGVALAHDDGRVWGGGDELFPIVAIHDGGSRFLYYIPNGTLAAGQLAAAWGDVSGFARYSPARSAGRLIPVWGPGSAVRIGSRTYAVFLMQGRSGADRAIEARTVAIDQPDRLSPPLKTYHWPDVASATVLLDQERGRWLLYYRDVSHRAYHVKAAHARTHARTQSDPATATPCV